MTSWKTVWPNLGYHHFKLIQHVWSKAKEEHIFPPWMPAPGAAKQLGWLPLSEIRRIQREFQSSKVVGQGGQQKPKTSWDFIFTVYNFILVWVPCEFSYGTGLLVASSDSFFPLCIFAALQRISWQQRANRPFFLYWAGVVVAGLAEVSWPKPLTQTPWQFLLSWTHERRRRCTDLEENKSSLLNLFPS